MPDTTGLSGLAFMGIIGAVAAGWTQVKAFAARMRSFVVVKASINGSDTARAMHLYCEENFRRSPFGDRYYMARSLFVRPAGRIQEVAYERPPMQAIVYFKGWIPIFFGGFATHTAPNAVADECLCQFSVIRGTVDPEWLIKAALDAWNASKGVVKNRRGRYRVFHMQGRKRVNAGYGPGGMENSAPAKALESANVEHNERYVGWSKDEIGSPLPENPMGALAIPAELEDARTEFTRWIASENWFKLRRVPWRRGWLLHSGPGCGKSSFIRALAQEADMPIFQYDLGSLSNEEMKEKWKDMQESVPCIALFEDIDAVFNMRENRLGLSGGGLTFDCLLNCMSGIESADGVFLMVTTNDLSSIDPALGISEDDQVSSRPGRLDRVIEVPKMNKECREKLAAVILQDCPHLTEELVKATEYYSGAQVTEVFVKHAQKHFWENQTT